MDPETLKEGKVLTPVRSSKKYMMEEKCFTIFLWGT